MKSSTSSSARAQIVAKNPPSCRRTPSFSSSSSFSSCSSYYTEDSPLGSAAPLRFSGVPFSWEHLPGIPKTNNNNNNNNDHNSFHKKESFLKQLPLPPPVRTPNLKKLQFDADVRFKKKVNSNGDHSFGKDPFVAALVECSKADNDKEDDDVLTSSKLLRRSISGKFGFVSLYTSCKRTCAVSESVVYLPRSSRTSYDLIHHRRSH
ncbi:uncharacterized protein LOC123203601 [Mangifera indica]|uniref:uncharacterized protein LOC123203601 n=1 Tax=Mangifera indica TaxID=29780 RepID=UPI001CFB5A46|nr:uncharacterized protein LOC123203601 [Mangifera indica]